MRSLRITFLLPLSGRKPVGGFKVVYEYANFLVRRGHQVTVVHPALGRIDESLRSRKVKDLLRTLSNYVIFSLSAGYRPDKWFSVDPKVRLAWTLSLAERSIPEADVIVATAWETAEWASTYSASKGERFYLIQHLETWAPGSKERSLETWKAPLKKVVIAKWLQDFATEMGQASNLITNGLDFSKFNLISRPEDRSRYDLVMVFHSLEWKGSADGLAAFEIAKREIPELSLTLFGLEPAPSSLPKEVRYHERPAQALIRTLYNNAAIFIGSSWSEGWGLPPAEAMMCGAAVAVTHAGADEVYAIHERTCLRSRNRDPEDLAKNIIRLVKDDNLRLSLAHQGHSHIRQFTWERAGAALEDLFIRETYP